MAWPCSRRHGIPRRRFSFDVVKNMLFCHRRVSAAVGDLTLATQTGLPHLPPARQPTGDPHRREVGPGSAALKPASSHWLCPCRHCRLASRYDSSLCDYSPLDSDALRDLVTASVSAGSGSKTDCLRLMFVDLIPVGSLSLGQLVATTWSVFRSAIIKVSRQLQRKITSLLYSHASHRLFRAELSSAS